MTHPKETNGEVREYVVKYRYIIKGCTRAEESTTLIAATSGKEAIHKACYELGNLYSLFKLIDIHSL